MLNGDDRTVLMQQAILVTFCITHSKCEGLVYIEHFLVLLSVVTDINFFPSNSEEIRNAVELQADLFLQQCSSKEKHLFMQ